MTATAFATGANWFAHARSLDASNARAVILADAHLLRELGYEGVELPLPHFEHALETLSQSFWQEVGDELRSLGLPPVSVHGPNWPGLDADLDRTLHLQTLYANATAALGAAALGVHPTYSSHPHACAITAKLLDRDTQLALHASDALGDSGTMLAIENLPTYGYCYLQELMSQIPRKNVGVCFDTGHWNVRPEFTLEQAVTSLADRIAHVHLSDNMGLCDAHAAPGQGNFPWQRFFSVLPASIRQRPLLLELSAPMLEQDDAALQKTRTIYQQALASARATLDPIFNS